MNPLKLTTETIGYQPEAIVLLSGGLDSATVLAIAQRRHRLRCLALVCEYGQRHAVEVAAAQRVADAAKVFLHRVCLPAVPAAGSPLVDDNAVVPPANLDAGGVAPTYVPGRNIVMIAVAAQYAEALGAEAVYCGVNAMDYSGYPDCRPQFIEVMRKAIGFGTVAHIDLRTPLIQLSKSDIIFEGTRLGVDYSITHSCYSPIEGLACGECDSCAIRRNGFAGADLPDPTVYAQAVV